MLISYFLDYIIPNKIKPIVLIAKLANIWTIHEQYIFSYLSFKKLKIIPATNKLNITIKNNIGLNQSNIIDTW